MEISCFIYAQDDQLTKQLKFNHYTNIQPEFIPQFPTLVYSTFNSSSVLQTTFPDIILDLTNKPLYQINNQEVLFINKLDQLQQHESFIQLFQGLNDAKSLQQVYIQQKYQIILLLKLNDQNVEKVQKIYELFNKIHYEQFSSSVDISEELPTIVISPDHHKKAQKELIDNILEARKQFLDLKNMQYPETNDSMIQANEQIENQIVQSQQKQSSSYSTSILSQPSSHKVEDSPLIRINNSDIELDKKVFSPVQAQVSIQSEVDILMDNKEEIEQIIIQKQEYNQVLVDQEDQQNNFYNENSQQIQIVDKQNQTQSSPYDKVASKIKDAEILLQQYNTTELQQSLILIQDLIDDFQEEQPQKQLASFQFSTNDVNPEFVIYFSEVEQLINKHTLCYDDSQQVVATQKPKLKPLKLNFNPLKKLSLLLDASYLPSKHFNNTLDSQMKEQATSVLISSPIFQQQQELVVRKNKKSNTYSSLQESPQGEYQPLNYKNSDLNEMSLIEAQNVQALRILGDKLEQSAANKEELVKSMASFNYEDIQDIDLLTQKQPSPTVQHEFNDIKNELHIIKNQVSLIQQRVKDSSQVSYSSQERPKYQSPIQKIQVPQYMGESLLDRVHKTRKNIMEIREQRK